MALTEAQKQLIAKNKREAERRLAVSARRRQAFSPTCSSSKQKSPPSSNLTDEQRRRMEENRRLALAIRERNLANHVAVSHGAVSHTISTSRSHASAHTSAALPLKRNELAKNGVVTPPHRVSRGQASAPQSCKSQKVVKTLGSVGPHFENGQILKVHGVHHRETNVLLGGAVHLVREPDNVSFYLCFLIRM